MALKPDDTSVVFACSTCHDWLDGRYKPDDELAQLAIPSHDRSSADITVQKNWYWFRGMRRTWRLLVEEGVLK